MSVFAIKCPETFLFVNATGWTDAFIQICNFRKKEYGIKETSTKDLTIDEVKQFVTRYGELLDFEKGTCTTINGETISLYDDDYHKKSPVDTSKIFIPMMVYNNEMYPQSMAITVE